MKERCYNPANKDYRNYGARGIVVCERWLESCRNFIEDMGDRPEGMSLDRMDGNSGYHPNNCRWVGVTEQNRNRPQRPARTVIIDGNEYYPGDLATISGISRQSIIDRAKRGLDYNAVVSPIKAAATANAAAANAQFAANRRADATCKFGHPWTAGNTGQRPGRRYCIACSKASSARLRERLRQKR